MRPLVITNTITKRNEKSLDKYLNEISKYEVLTPESELELFKRYNSGDESSLNRIVLHNLRFVVSVAKQYQHLGIWLGDIINEGNIGLIKAARRFDETKGFKFISYAVWWIRQAILQAVNEKSGKIKVPMHIKGKTSKILEARGEIFQRTERDATISEIAAKTGYSEDNIESCLAFYKKCQSLDAPVFEDSLATLGSLTEDKNTPKPDTKLVEIQSRKKEVAQLLKLLPSRQASILSLYFGIEKQYAMTLSDIADHFGITRERVRQIKLRAMVKLRRQANKMSYSYLLEL